MEIWKDIFRPGVYLDHSGETHEFTANDVVSACNNANAMARRNQHVPAIWEHDWTAVPVLLSTLRPELAKDRDRRASMARNTFGWADDYELRYEDNKPVLWAKVQVPDDQDAKQWQKTRYCSPRIDYDLTDSMGNTWPGCSISHIAATISPVQKDQKPVFLGAKPSRKTIFLGGFNVDLKAWKAVLSQLGITVPDTVTTPEQLLIALQTHAANNGAGDTTVANDDQYDDEFEDEDTLDNAQVSTANTAMLSTLPVETQQFVRGAMAAHHNTVAVHRKRLLDRLARVEQVALGKGIITQQRMAKLKSRLTGVNLSFSAESGALNPTGAIRELELIEGAVRATGGSPKLKSRKVVAVDLSGYGDGNGGGTPGPLPGTKEFDVAVKEYAKIRGDQATGRA